MNARWRECATADGSWTLWNSELGEACHSLSGAWEQARERYAGACRLRERALGEGWRNAPLLDVGTGLGLNLAAALEALAPNAIKLEAVTLEIDGECIERGLALYERDELRRGPWEPWHAPVRRALRAALVRPGECVPLAGENDLGSLVLRLGDARETLASNSAGPFEAVFLDPFSPRRASALWEEPFLASLAACMGPRAWLSTYSASFRVRLALARAGLTVGRGPRVGEKGEGTLARRAGDVPPLVGRVARRLEARLRSAGPGDQAFLRIR